MVSSKSSQEAEVQGYVKKHQKGKKAVPAGEESRGETDTDIDLGLQEMVDSNGRGASTAGDFGVDKSTGEKFTFQSYLRKQNKSKLHAGFRDIST